ncbi:ABC multidrug transporter, putative (fragment) [Xenorhabdus bovienii SS-2004]|uniref:ABC multidrug transporter, putative n=1 Tax=Xenorhabdus bovienii (strain SS-2004) TaxID=406818 RepID=D3V6V5_XENBS
MVANVPFFFSIVHSLLSTGSETVASWLLKKRQSFRRGKRWRFIFYSHINKCILNKVTDQSVTLFA